MWSSFSIEGHAFDECALSCPSYWGEREGGSHWSGTSLLLFTHFFSCLGFFSSWCHSMETHSPLCALVTRMDRRSCKLRQELTLLVLMHMYLFILVSHCFHTRPSNEGDSNVCISQGRKLYGLSLSLGARLCLHACILKTPLIIRHN